MTTATTKRLSLLCAFALALAGCGGGNGGGNGDGTAPTVVSVTPAAGATGVAVDTTVSVTFSEAVDCATLTATSFTLTDSGNAVSGSLACNGSSATFTPAANLAYSTLYTASVSSAATDSAGNPLAANHAWSFTTRDVRAVGGTVVGMNGSGLVLQLNGGGDLTVDANGTFAFPALEAGATYDVTVLTQPTTSNNQTCTVYNGGGTVADAEVTNISVTCSPWTKQFGAANTTVTATASATDAGGNVYVVGDTDGALHGQTLIGTRDYYLVKYDAYGNRVFTIQRGAAAGTINAHGVATDASGNVYVVGGTDAGLDGNAKSGNADFFLVKFDGNGNRLYTAQKGPAGTSAFARAVATDANGNVFVAGFTYGSLDGNPQSGNIDYFLAKYDSAGIWQYTRQLGASGATKESLAFGVATDGVGNVYVTGYTTGNLGGNTISGNLDSFVAKYANDGTLLSSALLGASGTDTIANGIAADASGNVYITGQTMGALGGALTGDEDMFLAKYNSGDGTFDTQQLGAPWSYTRGRAITTDASGNIYVAAMTNGEIDGVPMIGGGDSYVVKYAPNGDRLYARQIGAPDSSASAYSLALTATGELYVAGQTSGGVDGNTLTGIGDAFIVKYDLGGNRQ